jgi:phosphomevalonate kinase
MTPAANDVVVSAPGKLFLIGEYGVLHGFPAVVAAVDRRVTGRFVPSGVPATPLVQQVIDTVRAYLIEDGATVPDGAPELDSSALASGTSKLGLGSSAAVAAAGAGAMLATAGCDLEYSRTLTFTLANRAHRAAQGGRGSGADVAAAVHGGVIYYARRGNETDVQPLEIPAAVELVVFSTGTPSSTVDHVRALEAHAEKQPDQCKARLAQIGAAARGFTAACVDEDPRVLIDAVARANVLMHLLGREIGLPIVTPALAEAAKLALDLGGAAKPSGAGGGDVGVAFLTDQGAARTFRERAAHLGLEILSIRTGADGLRREPSGPERNHVVEG